MLTWRMPASLKQQLFVGSFFVTNHRYNDRRREIKEEEEEEEDEKKRKKFHEGRLRFVSIRRKKEKIKIKKGMQEGEPKGVKRGGKKA